MCGAVTVFVEGDCSMASRVAKLLPVYLWGCDWLFGTAQRFLGEQKCYPCMCGAVIGCLELLNGFSGSKNATRVYKRLQFVV